MGSLDKLLPSEAKALATPAGNEYVLPFREAERVIEIASAHFIAVGIELIRILAAGLGVEDYSGYDFSPEGDWPSYVHAMNQAALRWLHERQRGDGYGYILTSASQDELAGETACPTRPSLTSE